MKKWYQRYSWMLITALAVQMTGCASGKAHLSGLSKNKSGDQKLVEVDKSKKKASSTASKKGDSSKDKSADSQLAKKSTTKPKVQSSDKSSQELASAKDTAKVAKKPVTRESADPFQSEEFEALAASRAKASRKAESDSIDLVSKTEEEAPVAKAAPAKSAAAVEKQSAKIQEVAHKEEDSAGESGSLPEWAQQGEQPGLKSATKSRSPVTTAANDPESEFNPPISDAQEAREKQKDPAAVRSVPSNSEERPASTNLASLCPDAQGELREMLEGLKEPDTEGLKRGIHRIGRMGPGAKAAAPALVHLLHHKDGFVRTHCALALARMEASPPEAVQTVVAGLKSTDPGLRSFAAAVIPEMGPQASEALTILAESLNDRDGYVRLHAAEVLIRYDRWSYQALEALLAGLKDKDENIRWLATYSLAELAPESQETIDALIVAFRDPVMKVRIGAVYALGEIGPFAKGASTEMRKLADSTSNQELHSAILVALQQIEQ